ncbi:nuclease-related domain-containing protein [Salinibacterium sp. ZJ450]|uniref:nuclease-related domain-containing protein n=1 Tax=Salinibacterium sp. ZJ450 TaxID=2708338 RepID=UPI001CD737A5|nr:nuclease-related domain-containing protein [Salinibacterium sp. ZJ450]
MSDEAAGAPKTIQLRYAGKCRGCDRELPVGTTAVHDREARKVTCLNCMPEHASAGETHPAPKTGDLPTSEDPVRQPETAEPAAVFAGTAGASAQREYERRQKSRERRIQTKHPLIGGLILAMSDDPQSTRAWATGAAGEERLGRRLDRLANHGLHLLHDRRIPRSRANIDHMVVGPSGVFVLDAKKYKGRPSLRVEGGIIRPRVEKLIVGSRNCTNLVEGLHKQVEHVRSALDSADLGQIPVTGMLCFVEADWPLIGGHFTIGGMHVLWPKKATERVSKPGHIDAVLAERVHRLLAGAFPPA